MSKRTLKNSVVVAQSGICVLSENPLPLDLSLVDIDRITPKADGGIYTTDNTRVVLPTAHMERHGTLRIRESSLDDIKSLFDDRVQMMKLLLKENNQLLAYERRTDNPHRETLEFLKAHILPVQNRLDEIDKKISQAIKNYNDPFVKVCLAVPGLGPITVTALTVYVDLNKASTPSSLWKYCGLHTSSRERYQKGIAGGGNKTLRTVLWNTANSMMKSTKNPYRIVYDQVKSRLEISEKIATTNTTQGKPAEVAWKDTKPCHRHGAALRAIMKHILADYWMVGRTVKGLPTVPLYAEAVLGHTHIISPESRGWNMSIAINKIDQHENDPFD
jgi:hypothetical protein